MLHVIMYFLAINKGNTRLPFLRRLPLAKQCIVISIKYFQHINLIHFISCLRLYILC